MTPKLPIRISARAVIELDGCILLVEYDEGGLHYNLPGGGVEPGESLHEAVRREVFEETCAEIDEIWRLLLVHEYIPSKWDNVYGEQPGLSMIFHCTLKDDDAVRMPDAPDPYQTAVKWIPLEQISQSPDFPQVNLLPPIGFEIVAALRQFNGWNPHVTER